MPEIPHGTATGWRYGCRCPACTEAHNADVRETRNRPAADAALPSRARTRLLAAIRRGESVPAAAKRVGTTQQRVWARTRFDPAWRAKLDDALMTGRDPDVPHGTEAGYRHARCRCPECREAHHPRT